jgi:hypothetical protein
MWPGPGARDGKWCGLVGVMAPGTGSAWADLVCLLEGWERKGGRRGVQGLSTTAGSGPMDNGAASADGRCGAGDILGKS